MRSLTTIAGLVTTVMLVPTAAQAAVVADWPMDEPSGARTMNDASSLGGYNNGTVVGVETGVPGLDGGSAYRFGGSSDYVTVPDDSALSPGTRRIVLSATIKIANHAMVDDSYDVVRKGIASTPGGYWKMEVNRRSSSPSVGRLRCVFKGILSGATKVQAMKIAGPDVVDGRTHRLQCIRDGSAVQAVVDGKVFGKSQSTGSISNTAPVYVGAKMPGDDVMQGDVDRVTVDIG